MSKIEAITIPKWGMTMTEGTILEWLVTEGDIVAKGDEIVEIETSKINNVVESPVSGKVRCIILSTGSTAPVGALAAVLADEDASDDEIELFIASYADRASSTLDAESGIQARSVEVNGAGVSFLEIGEDSTEVAVFLHGFGGDLTTWMFNHDEVAANHRAVAIDLPGHGGSEPTRNADAFDGAIDAVMRVIADIGAEKVHLIGHSFGGGVATAVAVALGSKAGSLSLIAPIGLSETMSGDFLTEFVAAERRRPLQRVLERLVADPSKITSDMVEGTLNFKRIEGVPEALADIASSIADGDRQLRSISDDLEKLSCPVCVIWGEEDQIVPIPDKVPANIRLETIEKAGHMPQMEQSGAVNRLLLGLIASSY